MLLKQTEGWLNRLVDNEVIKYLIHKFEEKIRNNPLTPEFTKLANYYLINNNINEAITLLHSGLKVYPNYITAKFILGKCYLANKYFLDAKKIFNNILYENPDLSIVKKYLVITNDLIRTEVSRRHEDDVIPKLEFKTVEFHESSYNYNLFPSYEINDISMDSWNFEVDEISSEFNEFKEVFRSPQMIEPKQESKNSRKRLRNKFEVKIITETLADIFANQGNFFDAIEAYTYLLKIKPERKEQIEKKISEIEVKIQNLINDF